MKALFIDTSGWMAMVDGSDPQNEACCAERDDCLKGGGALVSTDYVLDETLTLLRMRLGLRVAASWWRMIERSTCVRLEWIDPGRAERARTWFFRWHDKDFSFTDCTSFALMKELHLRRAMTTDRHFEQAGFEMVP